MEQVFACGRAALCGLAAGGRWIFQHIGCCAAWLFACLSSRSLLGPGPLGLKQVFLCKRKGWRSSSLHTNTVLLDRCFCVLSDAACCRCLQHVVCNSIIAHEDVYILMCSFDVAQQVPKSRVSLRDSETSTGEPIVSPFDPSVDVS